MSTRTLERISVSALVVAFIYFVAVNAHLRSENRELTSRLADVTEQRKKAMDALKAYFGTLVNNQKAEDLAIKTAEIYRSIVREDHPELFARELERDLNRVTAELAEVKAERDAQLDFSKSLNGK